MPVILVLGKLSVENFEFEASYNHMGKKRGVESGLRKWLCGRALA